MSWRHRAVNKREDEGVTGLGWPQWKAQDRQGSQGRHGQCDLTDGLKLVRIEQMVERARRGAGANKTQNRADPEV